ncbi:MAG TPA: NADH:ubiquinone reductase (Na(+)-transporting) subunit C [Bacteroidales bacterium]|nr:NADH:ubiquinone reductase (Na(+)-transporting) subunit C [Bacteroidales bacterium]
MDRNSNSYIFIYSIIMVVVVALALSFVATTLKPKQEKNIAVEKKRNILSAIHIESSADNAELLFDKYITKMLVVDVQGNPVNGIDAFTIDLKTELHKQDAERHLPVYIAKIDDGSTKYIFPLYGKGLWGPIWGYIAVNDDMNSVYGTVFAHKGETPGLGAEIETKEFQKQFDGKTLFNSDSVFVSILVLKDGQTGAEEHSVDAISGGTITSKGLELMLSDCLKQYMNFFTKNK